MEYYLLYYDFELCKRTGLDSPDMIYAACLDDIPDTIAEFLAIEYGTRLCDQTGYLDGYVSTATAKLGDRPLYVIRPSLSFDESVQFLCSRAAARFVRESNSNDPNEVIVFMQEIVQVAKEFKEKFDNGSLAEPVEANGTLKRVEDILQQPRPFYLVDPPKGAIPELSDCPIDGKGMIAVDEIHVKPRLPSVTGGAPTLRQQFRDEAQALGLYDWNRILGEQRFNDLKDATGP